MQLNLFPVTLKEAFQLSPSVKHFVFQCNLTPPFQFIPGQFITIHFEHEGKMLKRSYSIANHPQQDNQIEFAAGYVEGGPGTRLLFNLKPGDTIQINGPFGRLILKEQPKRYILVATSTGVTPFRAMLPTIAERIKENTDLSVVILQGVQNKEDILYANEFRDFAKKYPQVTFRAQLSREAKGNLSNDEYSGYVQSAFPELQLNPSEDMVYLCGNPGMIDDAFEYLKNHGFAMQQIVREKYISK